MKRLYPLLFAGIMLSAPPFSSAQPPRPSENHKPLVVYLSRTQNTAALARIIQQQTGADLAVLETQTPYPQNYRAAVAQVARENEHGYLPPLKPLPHQPAHYQTVYLGFPVWDMQLPPPVKSWLAQTDLRGKTVHPFATHAGYGAGSSFADVKRLCRGCTVSDGLSMQGGRERDGILLVIQGRKAADAGQQISNWLKQLQK
ncbi:flavodoxin [Uruburuella testudinis]|uniref:Flavodoxin n=1 Tax=Uruburuella testudinis TaxID=1282863 RepID=A0ABY4DPC6_9NEIS|nr:flavodoxin [Uruburuella testudinis]UOO80900.1 flavodoxin [Uruburuella testudinis]